MELPRRHLIASAPGGAGFWRTTAGRVISSITVTRSPSRRVSARQRSRQRLTIASLIIPGKKLS
ncbi:MAG: hypothetical protein HYY96_10720 [Candidatus Tectomicrobia bacterium]|nr:hypothetical protein [Candidatus Tectomicrobia bacterium]